MNKVKFLWVVSIVLACANVWLLYNKAQLQKELFVMESEVYNQPDNNLVSASEPLTFNKKQNNKFTLVAIFSGYGCISCINDEVESLNSMNDNYPLEIYLLGDNDDFLLNNGAKFSFSKIGIEKLDDFFNKPITISNPVMMLVDNNDYVQLMHVSDLTKPGNKIRRENFYSRVVSIMSLK